MIVIMDGDQMRGIAPFYVEHISTLGFFRFRRLSFIGREVTDYLDIVSERRYEDMVGRKIVEALSALKSEFDVVVLEDMPDQSSFYRTLYEQCRAQSFAGDLFQSMQCPRTSLKETWAATLESFDKKHRKDISYEHRNINKHYSVQFELTSKPEEVSRDMDDFVAMHQERWTRAGYPGVFSETIQADFHREVAVKCFDRGWLFLAFLRLNGRRVAVNYGFHFRDIVMTYLNGMISGDDISKFSPGKVLHAYSMEESTKRKCVVYDFMRGQERYKYALDAEDIPNWTVILYHSENSLAHKKLKMHFLVESFHRRMRKERVMLAHVASEKGFLSLGTLSYLINRVISNVRDSAEKIKEPEKSLRDRNIK